MEPINTNNNSQVIRHQPPQSSSVEPIVKATDNTSTRPEFVSPKGSIDAKSGVYVVQFRNSSTGNVNFQYPNKKVVAEYSRTDKLTPTPAPAPSSEGRSVASSGGTEVASSAPAPVATATVASSSAPVAPLGTTQND